MGKYFLGAMVGANDMLIWFGGILLTDYEARLRIVEFKQVGIEEAQMHTLARMTDGFDEMMDEWRELLGKEGP